MSPAIANSQLPVLALRNNDDRKRCLISLGTESATKDSASFSGESIVSLSR